MKNGIPEARQNGKHRGSVQNKTTNTSWNMATFPLVSLLMRSLLDEPNNRNLSFLDDDNGLVVGQETTGFVIAHAILSVASFIAIIQGVYETRRKHYLYDRHSLRYFFPWAAFCQMVENLVLVIDVSGTDLPKPLVYIIYILESSLAPCLLLSTFDVTYSIHKTRHIPFCGVYDGHTNTPNPGCTLALKMSMRILALALVSLSILTNFNLLSTTSPYAGRAGWYWLVTEPWDVSHIHVLLELIPIGVTSLATFYFSIVLWRYGTSYSMVVHASPLNPWFSPFFGTLALMGGQWSGPKWFPLLSNLGIFLFVESILLVFMEVNKDMEAATELRNFLGAVGDKASEVRKKKSHRKNIVSDECDPTSDANTGNKEYIIQGQSGEVEMTTFIPI